mmetsp:Transcript_44235/g.79373  ORF Transcript_44235/g.79373 Transcript_44235/m.79373 type:complete len:135 (-) Transcript_44235:1677-2081(-)
MIHDSGKVSTKPRGVDAGVGGPKRERPQARVKEPARGGCAKTESPFSQLPLSTAATLVGRDRNARLKPPTGVALTSAMTLDALPGQSPALARHPGPTIPLTQPVPHLGMPSHSTPQLALGPEAALGLTSRCRSG